jgi:hypothetical protein
VRSSAPGQQIHLVADQNRLDTDEFGGDQILIDQITARLRFRGDEDGEPCQIGRERLVAPAVVGSAQGADARQGGCHHTLAIGQTLPDDAVTAHHMPDVLARQAVDQSDRARPRPPDWSRVGRRLVLLPAPARRRVRPAPARAARRAVRGGVPGSLECARSGARRVVAWPRGQPTRPAAQGRGFRSLTAA